jgi:hypothetical protein
MKSTRQAHERMNRVSNFPSGLGACTFNRHFAVPSRLTERGMYESGAPGSDASADISPRSRVTKACEIRYECLCHPGSWTDVSAGV